MDGGGSVVVEWMGPNGLQQTASERHLPFQGDALTVTAGDVPDSWSAPPRYTQLRVLYIRGEKVPHTTAFGDQSLISNNQLILILTTTQLLFSNPPPSSLFPTTTSLFKMPSTIQSTVAQIMEQARNDTRQQPWKQAFEQVAAEAEAADDVPAAQEELIKTGGPLDILTTFFTS